MKGGNANHLLNFQFQPISGAAHQGEGGGGRARRGSGGGGGSGRSKSGGGGVWGGGSTRGPMSKEQFLQASTVFSRLRCDGVVSEVHAVLTGRVVH